MITLRHARAARLAALIVLALPAAAFAQFRTVDPPQSYGDPVLSGIRVGFTIPVLVLGEGDAWDAWSTPFLRPDGTAPARPAPSGDADDDFINECDWSSAYARWAAMYSAQSVMDGDPATGWAEGAKGSGVGSVLVAAIPGSSGIGIKSGFQRSASLFAKNARPRLVRVWLLAAARVAASQFDTYYYDVKALAYRDVELKDAMGWQALPLPPASAPPTMMEGSDQGDSTSWFVAVQILSVYPGSAWEDCCVTEIGAMD